MYLCREIAMRNRTTFSVVNSFQKLSISPQQLQKWNRVSVKTLFVFQNSSVFHSKIFFASLRCVYRSVISSE